MDERQRLLLATAIVEYQGVLDHMAAIERTGVRVPFAVVGRARSEQRRLCATWVVEQGTALVVESDVVDECRGYITAHQEFLEELESTWEHAQPQEGYVSDAENEENDG